MGKDISPKNGYGVIVGDHVTVGLHVRVGRHVKTGATEGSSTTVSLADTTCHVTVVLTSNSGNESIRTRILRAAVVSSLFKKKQQIMHMNFTKKKLKKEIF